MLDDDLVMLLAALDAAPKTAPTARQVYQAALDLGWLPQRPVLLPVVPARPGADSIPRPTGAG